VSFCYKPILNILIKPLFVYCAVQIRDYIIDDILERPGSMVSLGLPLLYQSLIREMYSDISTSPSRFKNQENLNEFISVPLRL